MKEIKGFKNCHILTEQGIKVTSLLIKNGKIAKIGHVNDKDLITLPDNFVVCPGFIDQHIHGAAGSDAMDGTYEDLNNIACALAKEGTTAFLATTMTQSVENIDKSLKAVKEYIEKDPEEGARILGVHLEGPFISKDFVGAQPIEHVQEPTVENYKHYEEVSGSNIKLVTLACEVPGALDLVKYLKSKNTVASIGHSNSKYNDVYRALEAGASNITHTYNAQKPIHHREVGTVGAGMLLDEINCEAICDGIHLSPQAIQLLYKNKPADKFTLITDAMRAKHMPDGTYELGGQPVIVRNNEARLENGTLAGSVLKMNLAVHNIMNFLNIDLAQAVRCATINPAKNLGVFDVMGSISVGKYANFVILDEKQTVQMTIREGKVIFE